MLTHLLAVIGLEILGVPGLQTTELQGHTWHMWQHQGFEQGRCLTTGQLLPPSPNQLNVPRKPQNLFPIPKLKFIFWCLQDFSVQNTNTSTHHAGNPMKCQHNVLLTEVIHVHLLILKPRDTRHAYISPPERRAGTILNTRNQFYLKLKKKKILTASTPYCGLNGLWDEGGGSFPPPLANPVWGTELLATNCMEICAPSGKLSSQTKN